MMIKRSTLLFIAVLSAAIMSPEIARAQLVAFPGAEGAGRLAEGGRGGDVFTVTTLLDQAGDDGDGNPLTGSLRYGLTSASGPRTIVFGVGGQINLASDLLVENKSKITIAGQTAPGDGITIAGNKFHVKNTSDLIMRYLRVRVGGPPGTNLDAVWIEDGEDVIVDHVSASWGTDETISATHKSNNITVQWSILSEALGGTDGHAYGTLVNGGDFTYHHNLYTQIRSRNPRAQLNSGDTTRFDFVNNVIYNPFDKFGYGDEAFSLNLVGNYAIAGDDTKESTEHLFVAHKNTPLPKIHQSGNLMDLDKDGEFNGVDIGWDAIRDSYTPFATRFSLPLVTTESAEDALVSVLANAGASLVRDAVDLRVLDDVLNQAGRIIPGGQSESWVGGFPALNSGTALLDSDQDGMPDSYENSIAYLDPFNAADRNLDMNGNGYTDLEDYLNFLVSPQVDVLVGDYNGDGKVSAADYTVWRDTLGSTTDLRANGDDSNGVIDGNDYQVWFDNYGNTQEGSGNGASINSAAVPEPGTWLLALVGSAVFFTHRFRRWRY